MTPAVDLGIEIDLSPEQFRRAVPFEAFAALRRSAPVHWHEPSDAWLVTSYALVGEVNRDPRRFSSRGGPAPRQTLASTSGLTMLTMDPPEHTAHRRTLSGAFRPGAIRAEEGAVQRIVKEVLDPFVEAGGGDFVTEVCGPIATRVIGLLTGIEREDEAAVMAWTDTHARATEPGGSDDSAAQFAAYADRLLDAHRAHPRGDLVDRLLDARVGDVPLDDEQLRASVVMLVNGGAETTKHLFSNGLLALLEHHDARRRVVEGTDMALVVEEVLRFSTPVMSHSRWPTEAVEIGGQRIEPGQRTVLWMLSANRDEAEFDAPDTFDVDRRPTGHDSFGAGGPHFCIGAGLARLEARVLFEELRPHLDRIEATAPATRSGSVMFNAFDRVPIAIG